MLYAEIAINRDIPQSFTYHVPAHLEQLLFPGQMVRVPFRTGHEAGILIRLHQETPSFKTKALVELLDERPVLSEVQLHLAQWLAEKTLAPIGNCLWTMLPPGFTPRSDYHYALATPQASSADPEEQAILTLLARRGGLVGRELTSILGKSAWPKAMERLVTAGSVTKTPTLLPPTIKPKTVRQVTLSVPPEQLPQLAVHLGRESRRATLLEVLAAQPYQSIPRHELLKTAGVGMDVLRKAAEQGLVALNDDKTHVRLTIAPEQWLPTLLELRSATQLYAILDTLAQHQGVLAVSELYQLLPNANYNHLEKLQEAGYLTLGQSEVWRNSLARKTYVPTEPPQLTPEQSILWERISASMQGYSQDHGVFLLHGVTGSGKTELYIRAAELALSKGQQALILVPEIALTAQMVQRFAARFAGKVALIHSSLSAGERYDTWRRAREGLVQVVIGARSALFTPFPNLGLIVLDEEHDDSYKQSPPIPSPYYHSRDFAIEYMRLMGGTVILGSATPDVETYYAAQQGRYLLLELPNRVLAHRKQIEALAQEYHIANPRYESVGVGEVAGLALPPVQVVDMRQELMAGNISIFSRALATALSETLHLDQQALLFLNRRGSATFVFCRDCGYIARCPRCDTPLTFHRQGELLTCHGCGHREVNPTVCPDCHSHRIKYLGQGTEMIEKTVSELFPHARVMRWDQDTATSHHEHERIYDAFANHEADILVGTQMIAKGLDLPKVTLVGVISGDTALGLPDFRAIETTFQLLTQVAGRAGRSPLGGRVILQTYQPLHYAVQAAAKHDYHSFYAREIDYRRQLQWPPFTRVARLLFQDRVPQKAESEARRLAEVLLERIKALNFTSSSLVGPVPCFFARQDNIYRWHILLRSTDPLALLQGLDVGDSCTLDIDPVNVL